MYHHHHCIAARFGIYRPVGGTCNCVLPMSIDINFILCNYLRRKIRNLVQALYSVLQLTKSLELKCPVLFERYTILLQNCPINEAICIHGNSHAHHTTHTYTHCPYRVHFTPLPCHLPLPKNCSSPHHRPKQRRHTYPSLNKKEVTLWPTTDTDNQHTSSTCNEIADHPPTYTTVQVQCVHQLVGPVAKGFPSLTRKIPVQSYVHTCCVWSQILHSPKSPR